MRIRLLKKLIFVFFLFLIAALAYVQLIKGAYYFQLSQNNRIKLIRLPAARSLIYDRKNRVLAGVRPCFNVAILPQETNAPERVISRIAPTLGISEERLRRQFKKDFLSPFIPVVIARDISKETAIALECREADIPGLEIQTEPLRTYPYGESLCHVLGYLGQVSEEELIRLKSYELWSKDFVGRSGVEAGYDVYLRGRSGGMQVEVNNRGHKVDVLGARQPKAGDNLYLTVDAQLQEVVNNLLETRAGTCIVMDCQNGEILAMVSKPGFNPGLFLDSLNAKGAVAKEINELLNSKQAALVNRAISGAYPPGSIFKIVVACAALETAKINTATRFSCPGSLKVGDRDFFCWKLDGHGEGNIIAAIAHSCNVFFYRLGLTLGPDILSAFAHKFGLGSTTGVDLPFEIAGLVPSRAWKFTTYKERWFDGETANFSIGQGYFLVTPLQIARLIAAVANGGYLVQPHLVGKIADKKFVASRKKINFKDETLAIIRDGMRQVIEDEQGTAGNARIPGVHWGAKTGTAQTSIGLAHGWFGGFYPFAQPRIVVLVFLEYGGSGGDVPAKLAKQIVEYFIGQEAKEQ